MNTNNWDSADEYHFLIPSYSMVNRVILQSGTDKLVKLDVKAQTAESWGLRAGPVSCDLGVEGRVVDHYTFQ